MAGRLLTVHSDIALSVFVYPRRPEPSRDFQSTISTILAAHDKGSVEHVGEHTILLQSRAVRAYAALIRHIDFGREVRSWLILVPDGLNVYKARVTIPAYTPLQGFDKAWIALIKAIDNLDVMLTAEDWMMRRAEAGATSAGQSADITEARSLGRA